MQAFLCGHNSHIAGHGLRLPQFRYLNAAVSTGHDSSAEVSRRNSRDASSHTIVGKSQTGIGNKRMPSMDTQWRHKSMMVMEAEVSEGD